MVRRWIAEEPKILHEWDSLFPRAIVDLLALIEDEHLVELLIDAVASLIQGCNGSQSEYVGHGTHSLCPIQCCSCIETSGGVVPAKDAAARSKTFQDRNPLSLTTGHTTNVLVSNLGIMRVLNTERFQQELFVHLGVFFVGCDVRWKVVGDLHTRREVKGSAHRHGREEDLVLRVHNCVQVSIHSVASFDNTYLFDHDKP